MIMSREEYQKYLEILELGPDASLAEIKKSVPLGKQKHRLDELLVGEVMKTPAIWAQPNLTALEAAKLMLKNNIGALPLLEHGKLIGIISRTDLLNTIPR